MTRILNVVRMQLVNTQTFIWLPLIVLAGSFVITLVIWVMLIDSFGGDINVYSGGSQAPLWVLLVAGAQAMTLTFPFSQAMSITRREFYLGTLLTAALASAGLGAIFTVGALVEQATNGWFVEGYYFYFPWMWDVGAVGTFVFFFAASMLFFVVGFWFATIYKRWGSAMLATAIVVASLAILLALWWLLRSDAWGAVWEWYASLGTLGVSLCGLVLTAVLAASAFLTLRRATP